jgi:ankyrin repeat protein
MHIAASGATDVVNFLLNSGADIDDDNANNGWTPLLYAAYVYSPETVLALLNLGANATARGIGGITAVHLLSFCDANPVNPDEFSSLLKGFISSGVDINSRATSSIPLLRWLASDESDERFEATHLDKSISKETSLHWAAAFRRANTIRLLLTLGAGIDLQDSTGSIPLIRCIKETPDHSNLPEAAQELLRQGADEMVKDDEGLDARAWCARKNLRFDGQIKEVPEEQLFTFAGQ